MLTFPEVSELEQEAFVTEKGWSTVSKDEEQAVHLIQLYPHS